MKTLISERVIEQLNYNRTCMRPEIIMEGFSSYSSTERDQINESYNLMYGLIMDNVINEFSLSGAKAKIKGSVAGAAAKMSGVPASDNTGRKAELQSLFDDLKRNIGTMVAQHKNDITKLGFGPDDTISRSLTEIEAQLASFGQIEVKDSSLMGKAGKFAQDKVLPLVGKVISPISNKIEQMYQKSGPLRDFDAKYEDLRKQITTKYPKLAEPMAKFSEYAKKHKAKATFIVGALTALLVAATSVGGPGAFVIGVGLRGMYGMLAGESPVKSFGKAAITAAIGKMAGGVIKDLFGDVSLGGGEETLAKAGVGELTGREAALDALQDKYPDAGSFRELMELDPEGAQELQQQFARTGSSTSMGAAEDKIDLLMKGNEVTDAGMDSGTFVGGELQLEPGAESALLDLDAKGLSMMSGDAEGNIKDLVAWSDEYNPTGSDFKSRMLIDLKANNPEGFRQHLFHMMSKAKEEEMKAAFQSLTAAARESGVEVADAQAMMELDPAGYQHMELAKVQKLELEAAYYEGQYGTYAHKARTVAGMFRKKYNAQFPDDLAGMSDDF